MQIGDKGKKNDRNSDMEAIAGETTDNHPFSGTLKGAEPKPKFR